MADKTFTTYDIAKFCDVYPSSVIHWINDGKLKAYSTPGGHHRVTPEDLRVFLKEFKIPLPPELSSGEKKILVVDDDAAMARCVERAFARHPTAFKAEICHTGIDALIRIGQAPPDLVILDIVMPKMDGFQVCKILKSKPETSGVKIIGISGKKLPSDKKLEEYKIDAFFRKPLDVVELLAKSAEILRLDLPLSPKPARHD